MSSIEQLRSRLEALSTCVVSADLKDRAKVAEVALGAQPSAQFLSDLFDVGVSSVAAAVRAKAAAAAEDEADAGVCGPAAAAQQQLVAMCVAASLHYLPGQDPRVLQQFLDSLLLPALAAADAALPDRACRVQACSRLAALLAAGGHWPQLRQLVGCCGAALAAAGAAGVTAGEAGTGLQVAGGAAAAASRSGAAAAAATAVQLPLLVACTLLTAVVHELRGVVAAAGAQDAASGGAERAGAARQLLGSDALPALRRCLRPLLTSPTAAVRQAGLKSVVPAALACAQTCGGAELAGLAGDVWRLALELLSGGSCEAGGGGAAGAGAGADEAAAGASAAAAASATAAASAASCTTGQRTALSLLVSCCGLLQDPAAGVDVAGCGRFWELLRTCLSLPADVDALERKRALLLLQRLAPAAGAGRMSLSAPGWVVWGALYDILEALRLVLLLVLLLKQIDQLHAPAPEYVTEAVVPKNYIPKKKELKSRKAAAAAEGRAGEAAAAAAAEDEGLQDGNQAAGAGGDAGWAVPVEWQCVLWARALQHGNQQVQRLAMRTLLQRDWSGSGRWRELLVGLPAGFVAGVLLPALGRDLHYRGGAADLGGAVDVQAAASKLLRSWFAAAPLAARLEALAAVRCVVAPGCGEVSRLGLQQVMRCLAVGSLGAVEDGQLLAAITAAGTAGTAAAAASFPGTLLGALRGVLGYLGNFTGMSYKRSVWGSVVLLAAAAAPVAAAGLAPALRLLAELPPATLEPGGEMREAARSYLLGRPPSHIQALITTTVGSGSSSSSSIDVPLTPAEVATVTGLLRGLLDDFWAAAATSAAAVPATASRTPATATAAAATATAASAAAVARLLVLFSDEGAAAEAVCGRLRRALVGSHGRPYAAAGELAAALGLLRELLQAAPQLPLPEEGSSSSAAAAAASPLQLALLALVGDCCDDCCSAASTSSDAFLLPQPQPESSSSSAASAAASPTTTATAASSASPTAPTPALERAEAAWACVALGLSRAARSPDPALLPAVRKLAGAALALLGQLCAAPLPAGRPAAVVTGLRAAAAAANALRAAAAVSPAVAAAAAERLDCSALAAAALRDADAATAAVAAAAAAAPGMDVSAATGEVLAAKWPLVDAATACAAEIPAGRSTVAAEAAAAAAQGGLRLRREVLCVVLAQSVAALAEYPEGQVLPLLRCLRRCWGAVAAGGAELQEAAARAMGCEGEGEAGSALQAVCWGVVRALWNALCATPRRTGPLCAAFVNTALMPRLFVQQPEAVLQSLHGPHGPCRWLLSRLLDWGGTSARFLLLLACQLGAFLVLQPALAGCYCREIQALLLWGSRKGAAYDPDMGGSSIEVTEAEELAAVAAPPDPALVSSPSITSEVGPRVALLCCLHQLAEAARCVWPPPAAGSAAATATEAAAAGVSGSGSGAAAAPGAAVEAKAADTKAEEAPAAPKRPVIIFGESPMWEEATDRPAQQHQQQAQAAASSSASSAAPAPAAGASSHSNGGGASRSSAATAAATAAGAEGQQGDGDLADYGVPPPADPHHPALAAGRLLWRQLLGVALSDPQLSTDKVRNGSELHRQKVRLWQSLVVLTSFVPREEGGAAVEAVLLQINGNNPPTVKQYMEAVVAALVLREPRLLHSHLLPLVSKYHRHASGLGSSILIAAQVLLHSPAPVQRACLRPLLLALSPWLMCHGHAVRTYAQLVLWALLSRFPPEHPMWAHSLGDLAYLRQTIAFMNTNNDLVRLRRNIGDPILEWSPAGLAHPARVFASGAAGVCLAGSPSELATFEGAPATLVDRVQAFLLWERHRLREELSDREVERLYASQDPSAFAGVQDASSGSGIHGAAAGGKKAQQPPGAAAGAAGGLGDFQRKITPEALLAELGAGAAGGGADGEGGGGGGGLASLLLEGEDAGGDWKAASASASRRHDILLVASLIDKVPNLAGLARTCEVLGAGRLVLADTTVAADPLFTSISVTAEQWLPMEEVKPAALLAWLERKAAEGYTLVGLEQTAESVRLPDYVWPERVVLVLGREKEGIPPEVLALLDAALEVPQRGIIRSLNVHVTGAIALYDYVRKQQQPGGGGAT